jgi:hypothetical protein
VLMMSSRPRCCVQASIYAALTVLVVLLSYAAPAHGASTRAAGKLRATVRSIALPGSSRYEPIAVQASPSGSVWVVGRHTVWDVSPAGRIIRVVQLPTGVPISRAGTATVTADGGVSFVVVSELLGEASPVLDHVSPAGALSTVGLPTLTTNNAPGGPMAVGAGSLWGVGGSAPPGAAPTGAMVSINPTSGATSSYPVPLTPFTINNAPSGDFWLGGITTGSPERHSVSLVTPTGTGVKTINLPGRVGNDNDIMSAPAPGLGMWLAVSGGAAYVSGSSKLTTYRLPYGTCEVPDGLASGPDGTGWMLGEWPSRFQCGHVPRFPMQLIRMSKGQLVSTSIHVPNYYYIPPALATFADGKVWVIGGKVMSGTVPNVPSVGPVLYVISVK